MASVKTTARQVEVRTDRELATLPGAARLELHASDLNGELH